MELKGRVLHNRYRIYEVAGSAGMATVCLARETATGAIVTVLVLEPALTRDASLVRRFLRSAELAAGAGHPCVAPVLDYGQEQDICYMVMPFGRQGTTLAELEHTGGPLPPAQAARISSCIASALEAAAAFGGIAFHGALAPAGIIVTPSGDAQVTGFGTAPASGAVDRSLGEKAAAYAAPEQLDGRGVDIRSDLYTLGVMLYEMLTGTVPAVSEVRSFLNFGGSAQMERFLEKVPAQLRPVLSGLLVWDPDERFSTPGDVLEALAKAGFPAPPRPVAEAVAPGREHGPVLAGLDLPEKAAAPVHMVGMEQLYGQETAGAVQGHEETAPLTGGVGASEVPPPEEGSAWEVAEAPVQPSDSIPAVAPMYRRARRWVVPLVAGMLVALAAGGYLIIARPFEPHSATPGGSGTKPPSGQTVTTGSLSVTSVPAGARVLLDGADTGKVTPVTLSGVAGGNHGVVLRLTGYQDGRQSVSVAPGGTAAVQLSLVKSAEASGTPAGPVQTQTTLRVASSPAGAEITLDGKDLGRKTPATLTVTAGSHTVQVRLSGYQSVTRTVTTVSGKQTSLSIELSKTAPVALGSLRIESTPAGAAVWVDGKALAGRTPLTCSVALGSHTVRVSMQGYENWSRSGVQVVKGIQTVLAARLVSLPSDASFASRTGGFGFTYPSSWKVIENPDAAEPTLMAEVRSPEGPSVRVLVVPLKGASLQSYLADLRGDLEKLSGLTITASGTKTVHGIVYQHLVTLRGGTQTEYCLLQSAGSVYQLECAAETSLLPAASPGFQTILGSFFTAP